MGIGLKSLALKEADYQPDNKCQRRVRKVTRYLVYPSCQAAARFHQRQQRFQDLVWRYDTQSNQYEKDDCDRHAYLERALDDDSDEQAYQERCDCSHQKRD